MGHGSCFSDGMVLEKSFVLPIKISNVLDVFWVPIGTKSFRLVSVCPLDRRPRFRANIFWARVPVQLLVL